ncbi:hypothetical protein PANT_3c00074 [Moesziomyces antarcticus T-34]|uniref:Zn(2)-C6 fungal-type domain-containing protein n=1 Tax=Pseudozyma antarctica (strain T-34) TaxID=1151754 RepID=M9LJN0_PSEA3|nr:hypothetical protein PANT_3c00074 [Moesziomyces antarcticus T-34]
MHDASASASTNPAISMRRASASSPGSPSPSPQQPAPARRTKVSCFPCRTRKSKCDHARPCSSCVLRGTEQQCADPNGAAPSSAQPPSSSSGTSTPVHSAAKSRPLPSSASIPGLTDYATNQPINNANSLNSSHAKRRRTEAPPPPPGTAAGPSQSRTDPDQDIHQEVNHMKQALARLEDMLERRSRDLPQPGPTSSSSTASSPAVCDYKLDPIQDCPGEADPPSKESRQRWHRLRFLLPPLVDTHTIMYYLFVEGDWLMPWIEPPRFIARWRHAYERQAISDVLAIQVLCIVANAALLLSDNRQRIMQCPIPVRTLHVQLMKEAVSMADAMPALRDGRTEAESCDLLEIMLSISFYFRCIGKEALMGRYCERAVSHAVRIGYDNEFRQCWLGLTPYQVERRRLLMMEAILTTKWIAFHCRKELAHLRTRSFNLGRAHLENVGQLPPLSAWPESDSLSLAIGAHARSSPTSSGAATANSHYLPWRPKTEEEREVVRTYVFVSWSFSHELTAIVDLISKTETRLLQPEALTRCTKEDMRDMARQTRQILARLNEWFHSSLPKAGLGFDQIVNSDANGADPIQAKRLATMIMVNHAYIYKTSILCRAWLLLSDRLQSLNDLHREDEHEHPATMDQHFFAQFTQRSIDHVQHMHAAWLPPTFLAEIEAAVLENARLCIRLIPVIRTLQSQPWSHFYISWVSQSSMQVAVNLAVPLVRSHHRQNLSLHTQRTKPGAGVMASRTDELRQDIVTIFEAVSQLSDKVMARRTARVLNGAMRFGGIEQPMSCADDDDDANDVWQSEENSGQMHKAAEGLALLSAASASDASARTPSDRYTSSSQGSPALATRAWESTGRDTIQARWEGQARGTTHSHSTPAYWHKVAPASHSAAVSEASVPATSAVSGMEGGVARQPMWWETRFPIDTKQPADGSTTATAGSSSSGNTAEAAGGGQTIMSDSQLLDELLNLDVSFWQFVVDGTGLTSAS